MGSTYWLVNVTRKETLNFRDIGAWKPRELAGHPAAAAITTWYLLRCRGDAIAFLRDEDLRQPCRRQVFGIRLDEIGGGWPDRTEDVVRELVEHGILEDRGSQFPDAEEPELRRIRDLRNCWFDDGGPRSLPPGPSIPDLPRSGDR